MSKSKWTISVEIEIDADAYALNYGEGYPPEESAQYAMNLVHESLTQRFDAVGGWATVGQVSAEGPGCPRGPGGSHGVNSSGVCVYCEEQVERDLDVDEPSAEQERAWDEQYDGTSLGG